MADDPKQQESSIRVDEVMQRVREKARDADAQRPPLLVAEHHASAAPPPQPADTDYQALARANTLFAEIQALHGMIQRGIGMSHRDWERLFAEQKGVAPPGSSGIKAWIKRIGSRVIRPFSNPPASYQDEQRRWMDGMLQLHASEIETLNNLVGSFHQEIAGLKEQVHRLFARMDQLTAYADRMQEQLNGTRDEIRTASERIDHQGDYIAENSRSIKELQNSLEALRSHTEEVWSNVLDQANERYLETYRLLDNRTNEMNETLQERVQTIFQSIDKIREDIEQAGPAREGLHTEREARLKHLLTHGAKIEDFDFLAFEAFTRGDEAQITAQQEFYSTIFEGRDDVLDIGCGRGEFLEILKRRGVGARGIDTDAEMVRHCQQKGLNVELASALDYLEALPAESLGGLFAAQVVEHLTVSEISKLVRQAYRVLLPGAPILLETVNPTCLSVFSGAFFTDPTHVKPVHPTALKFFLSNAGFINDDLHFSVPVPDEHKLARVEAPADPKMDETVKQINDNIDRLNSLLYGYAHYAAVAYKPQNGGRE